MSEENQKEKTAQNNIERLETLAKNQGKTVEELLISLEEKQAVKEENLAKESKSTGSLKGNESGGFDPTGSEFLKGIWNR